MGLLDRINDVVSSAAIKVPVKAVTSAEVTLAGEQTVGTVAIVDGDRVLVKDQSDASENGVYDASTGLWTRAPDFDGVHDVKSGTIVTVTDTNDDTLLFYRMVASGDVTFGETDITFEPVSLGPGAAAAFTPGYTGALPTTMQAYLDALPVPVTAFGADSTGVASSTAAIDTALAASKRLHFPAGEYLYDGIPAFDNHVVTGDDATIVIPAGVHTMAAASQLQFVSGLTIRGQAHQTLAINSIGTIAGSAGDYNVPLNVTSEGLAAAGGFVVVEGTAGTGSNRSHEGGWRIESVGTGQVVVKNTSRHASFPTSTVSSGDAHLLRSVVLYNSGTATERGLIVSAGQLYLKDVAVQISGASAADGSKCLHVGIHRSGQSYEHSGASVVLDQYVCFSGAGNHGVVVGGNGRLQSKPGNASCGNNQDGWHSTESGSMFIKFVTGNGNDESGFMSEQGGHMECDGSAACGNGKDGFESIAGGRMGCNQSTTLASYNQRHGVFADNDGHVRCGQGLYEFSQNRGIFASECSYIDANSATVTDSVNEGVYAGEASKIIVDDITVNDNDVAIEAENCSFITGSGTISLSGNNTDYSVKTGSQMLISGSYLVAAQAGNIDRLSFEPYLTADAPSGNEGDAFYASDGDAGSPCLAFHDGTSWKRVTLGATISAT